jgi:transcriptional regulator with XRE-family HTH domain
MNRMKAGETSARVGLSLRAIRRSSRYTQIDVAEFMQGQGHPGWSRVTVSDVERGRRLVSVDELEAIVRMVEWWRMP